MDVKKNRFSGIRLLYLCEREIYLTRTSRGRFHSVDALARHCHVMWSGPGWDNWDNEKKLDDNVARLYENKRRPDIIYCFKPFTVKGFAETSIPACVSYMEMIPEHHPSSYTKKEILENHIDLVFCFYKNEMMHPDFRGLPCKMINIPHGIDPSIFTDYHLPKDIDVLVLGAYHALRYPLRTRLENIVRKLRVNPRFSRFKMGIWNYPGKRIPDAYTNRQAIEYAKGINRTKICLTCSGLYHSRYAKYAEIPACRSLLMADLPDEDQEFFEKFMAVIHLNNTDKEIEEKILFYLEHEDERNRMTNLGYNFVQTQFTWDLYSEKFLAAVEEFLVEYKGQKLPYWRSHD